MRVYVATIPDGAIVGTVAELLLRAVEHDSMAAGCARLTLDTTIPLRRAIRFYERNGFAATGKVTDFFGMPLHEYVKTLPPSPRPLE